MKKVLGFILMLTLVLPLTACSNKALDEATAAVKIYNVAVIAYNEKAEAYNDAVRTVGNANEELQAAIDGCQDVINVGEEPYDSATLEALKRAMSDASGAKVKTPEELALYEEVVVSENAKKTELEELTAKVTSATETMNSFTFPERPETPDYSSSISALSDAKQAYEDSIQSLKQITAPTDDFVIKRIQTIDTITSIAPVTEEHDPNGKLNKQGGYIGCIYFRDSQVDQSKLYVDGDPNDVIDVGTQGGGAIEIFRTVDEAQVRDTYLAGFDGTAFTSGSHYIKGTCLIRTSDELNGTQQLELTEKITQALIKIEH